MSFCTHVCSTVLRMKTMKLHNNRFQWFLFIAACNVQIRVFSYLLISFCHFVFRMGSFPSALKTNLKKSRSSGSQIFIKIGSHVKRALEDVSFRVILKHQGCWSWPGGWKRGANRIRGHWFWGLRHLLQTSTWGSGKFQAEPVCFVCVCVCVCVCVWQKGIAFKCSPDLYFYAMIVGFFRSA